MTKKICIFSPFCKLHFAIFERHLTYILLLKWHFFLHILGVFWGLSPVCLRVASDVILCGEIEHFRLYELKQKHCFFRCKMEIIIFFA